MPCSAHKVREQLIVRTPETFARSPQTGRTLERFNPLSGR
jgi:hypothetical protein